jgi:glycosyltransferase involved in cell wall biosynthesis
MPDNIQGPVVFVSNFDLNDRKGGFDGLGGKIYDILAEKHNNILLVDHVNPPYRKIDVFLSKIFRIAGIPALFPAFSKKRLKLISKELERRLPRDTSSIIFHGITPWIGFKPSVPYFAFSDCSFDTYMDLYHERQAFSAKDLHRIGKCEGEFMANAMGVFFTVDWSLNEAKRQYGLDGSNLMKMGQGPTMDIPKDAFHNTPPGKQFVFIGTDFIGKGGIQICEAFQKVYEKDQEYKLIIIGQKPPAEYLQKPGISFLGYINKSSPEGRKQFSEIYRQSRALLMLTKKDIFPIVLIEAGLYGCPAVANKQSGIPEVIQDGKTGYLIESSTVELENAMMRLAEQDDRELVAMRQFTSHFYAENYSWEQIYSRIHTAMSKAGVVH